jgi:hypothetical protein
MDIISRFVRSHEGTGGTVLNSRYVNEGVTGIHVRVLPPLERQSVLIGIR